MSDISGELSPYFSCQMTRGEWAYVEALEDLANAMFDAYKPGDPHDDILVKIADARKLIAQLRSEQSNDAFERAVRLPDFWHRLEPYCMRLENAEIGGVRAPGAVYVVTADRVGQKP